MIDWLLSCFYLVALALGLLVILCNALLIGCLIWFSIWVRMYREDENDG